VQNELKLTVGQVLPVFCSERSPSNIFLFIKEYCDFLRFYIFGLLFSVILYCAFLIRSEFVILYCVLTSRTACKGWNTVRGFDNSVISAYVVGSILHRF
jgi:hypothetical protein